VSIGNGIDKPFKIDRREQDRWVVEGRRCSAFQLAYGPTPPDVVSSAKTAPTAPNTIPGAAKRIDTTPNTRDPMQAALIGNPGLRSMESS
jgi:hypothetical protein